jgi:hypothetical protein
VSDEQYFNRLVNLIGSVHKTNFNNLKEIAVFDIGLTASQRNYLKKISKIKLCTLEPTNPDMLKLFSYNNKGRIVRGWYSWKPVVIKQALDMYEYVLFLDAGTTVLQPLDDLFTHIKQNNYFLWGHDDNIINRSTTAVIEKIMKKQDPATSALLQNPTTTQLTSSIIGVSKKQSNFVNLCYEATKDITLFADDGSAKLGFGEARHDQIIFSIYARICKLKINGYGWMNIMVDNKSTPIHIHWAPSQINGKSIIYHSRTDLNYKFIYENYIKFQ